MFQPTRICRHPQIHPDRLNTEVILLRRRWFVLRSSYMVQESLLGTLPSSLTRDPHDSSLGPISSLHAVPSPNTHPATFACVMMGSMFNHVYRFKQIIWIRAEIDNMFTGLCHLWLKPFQKEREQKIPRLYSRCCSGFLFPIIFRKWCSLIPPLKPCQARHSLVSYGRNSSLYGFLALLVLREPCFKNYKKTYRFGVGGE